MNFERIYDYRFKNVNREKKMIVWKEVAEFIYEKLNKPNIILDPAAGFCEFINQVPVSEKWAIDINEKFLNQYAHGNVRKLIGNNLVIEWPDNYFDAVFISNFLEHLHSQEEVAVILKKAFLSLKKGGMIAVMGPNFKYATREYFDFSDHTVILSELGLAEHLYGAGFEVETIYPQFLPLSFRGNGMLPVTRFTVRSYLRFNWAWKLMGKQFLLIGKK